MKKLRLLQRTKDTIPALWLLAFLAANTCLLIHSCFHNANLATGEMRNWLWLGLLLLVSRPQAEQWLRPQVEWQETYQDSLSREEMW